MRDLKYDKFKVKIRDQTSFLSKKHRGGFWNKYGIFCWFDNFSQESDKKVFCVGMECNVRQLSAAHIWQLSNYPVRKV